MTEAQAQAIGTGVGGVAGGILGLAPGAVPGYMLGKQAGGAIYKALGGEQEAIDELKGIDYADYNQAYFEELQKRANMGLPEEQKRYAEIQADRAAGIGLQATEDQRGGLMGVRQAQMGLSDAYRNIALSDAQARMANQQQLLGEIGNRGMMGYQEAQAGANMDLALAGRRRQEMISLLNSGMQTVGNVAGLVPMAFGMPPVPVPTPQVESQSISSGFDKSNYFQTPATLYNPSFSAGAPPQYSLNYSPPSGGINQPSGFSNYK